MKLFTVPKVGLYLESIVHGTEKRHGDDVKIITLALRVQPFDSKLAQSVSDDVRVSLFKLNHPDPKPHLRRCDFALGVPRQILKIYASSDTAKPTLALDQVRITGTYARTQKDVNGFAFIFRASFGPAGRQELEYIQNWHLSQRWVTFDEAEPGMFDDPAEVDEDATEADAKAQRPTPMFDDPRDDAPAAAAAEAPARAHRPLISHQSKRGARKGAKKGSRR